MYRVMIIDDEVIIRQGMRLIVSWEDLGYEVVGEAANGVEGKDRVLANQPDLIFIDVSMPGMTGLDMLADLRQEGYQGKAVFLTGYAEFDYAQEAIQLRASDYLVKPLDEDLLVGVLHRVKEELDGEKDLAGLKNDYQELVQVKDFKSLLFNPETPLEDSPLLNEKASYWVVMIGCSLEDKDSFYDQYLDSQKWVLYFETEFGLVVLYKNKSYRQLHLTLTQLKKHYHHAYDGDFFVTVGRQVTGKSQIRSSYIDANELFQRKFIYPQGNIVFWELDQKQRQSIQEGDLEVHYLYGLVEVGHVDALEVYLFKLENKLVRSDYSVDKIKGLCVFIYDEVMEQVHQNFTLDAAAYMTKEAFVHEAYRCAGLHDILLLMKSIFEKVIDNINNGNNQTVMKRIVAYINKNYYKNLKLEGIAKLFNYNNSYLGQLFKDQQGISFNKYLESVRIEHGKEYLSLSDLKIYEIADKIGFSSVDYFYLKFKKQTGMSPKQYRCRFKKEMK